MRPAADPATVAALHRHVAALAAKPRNLWCGGSLQRAATYIDEELTRSGYRTRRQAFEVGGQQVANLEAEWKGAGCSDRVLVIGAHYDTVPDSPGANDNSSGVAVLLETARRLAASPDGRVTIRFVAFVNEEPPFFMTADMGSLRYATEAASRGDDIAAMISLETIGYYTDAPHSQRYPAPFQLLFPDRGNFLAMVSDFRSVPVLRRVSAAFRSATSLPVIASPAPAGIPGISWSDHWSFWQHGYRAVMLTDTAPFRYPHYHASTDTPDKLDYHAMAAIVAGCSAVISAWR